MGAKIAINGFGRIGRNIVRALVENAHQDLELVAINDLAPVATNAHLLEFDSVHGRFPGTITAGPDWLDFGRGPVRVTAEADPAALAWGDVDIVLECTGRFTARDKAAIYLRAGAKRVLVSAPSKGADATIVYGVNHDALRAEHQVISNGSCTTNCLAPLAQLLHGSVGIAKGMMTTIHSYTGDQPTLDRQHSDLYRARAAAMNMIPTSTGAARAIGLVLPELEGKLDGTAIRVPTPNVSCVDLTFEAERDTSAEEINALVAAAAQGPLQGILGYETAPLVSMDLNHDPRSSIFAADQTKVLGGRLVRVLSWYDNEWGFSNRMCDTARAIAQTL